MKNVVLERFPEIDYVVLARLDSKGKFLEFVAAHHYNDSDDTWSHGHYFYHLEDLMEYLQSLME